MTYVYRNKSQLPLYVMQLAHQGYQLISSEVCCPIHDHMDRPPVQWSICNLGLIKEGNFQYLQLICGS